MIGNNDEPDQGSRGKRRSFLRLAFVQLLPRLAQRENNPEVSKVQCVGNAVSNRNIMTDPLQNARPLRRESDLNKHRLDVNPEANQFSANDGGSTEQEYLKLISALIGVFKPTHLFETGAWNEKDIASLLAASQPGARFWTFNDQELRPKTKNRLLKLGTELGVTVEFVTANTGRLMREEVPERWGDIMQGKATFGFLDTLISTRGTEFEYVTDPANGVLDFSRPLCICIHDMSRYRHPLDQDTASLASTVRQIETCARERGWDFIRFHQSRGMFVLVKYPDHAGIDGKCIVPDILLFEDDRANHIDGTDPYLISDYYPILADLVKKKSPKKVLEIGLRYGYSFAVMLNASSSIVHAIAVDSTSPVTGWMPGAFETTQEKFQHLRNEGCWPNLERLEFIDCDTRSIDHMAVDESSVDFAYIDGDTDPAVCLHDMDLVLPLLADDAVMVVDDIHHCALREVVAAWADAHSLPYSEIPDSSRRGRLVITNRESSTVNRLELERETI